jgi:succinate dehydrogenase / fumarate reductase cytochrome b subunit
MNRLLHLLRTTIGRKLIVAVSGIVLILFIIGHVSGNMTIYVGQSALNNYAHFLQTSPMLWVVRLAMLAILLLHITLGIAVTRENRMARPEAYHAGYPWYLRLYQARMIISGLVLLAFIAGHVAHMALGAGVGEVFHLKDASGNVDVYSRVLSVFQNAWIAWVYIIVMLLLAMHLKHTVRAVFQTLGFFRENYFEFLELLSWAVTLVVLGGFISIPLSVQLGWLALP